MTKRLLHPRSLAAQAMGKIDPLTKAVVPPIHVSTTYIRDEDNAYSSGFIYGRPDNETVHEAQAVLAMLEEAKAGALLFGSGMAAATAVFQALSPGDHVVASKVMYWALRAWLLTEATRWGLKIDFVETDDLAKLKEAVKPGVTKLIWAETPSNPLWTITDIAAVAEIAHAAGAKLAVDSTCASPVHTRPLTLGADIVMHAATKVLNGHSDVVAGALCANVDDEFWARIKTVRKGQGGILGPFEAYLLMRGMRTLHVRQERQSASAMALATRLSAHPLVSRVLYPGLPQHPGHDIAARQMEGGFGFMLSVQVSGGEAAAVKSAAHVELYKRATSLGGVESLIEHRASIEGAGSPCPPDLLRLSTGIEDVEDLFADLDQALKAGHA
ncbi:Cystathionine gamma-synthase [Bosea sp. 62]|uniref:trans-sulfuration enzyme family protein n=1 Tax=unclassified Bosea (in: a-proteobacteria) TaxID=2653178 RepID=UPI00125B86AD|nr:MULTISPECIES: aminotransferase class I/II-fold pyridoxal phosphate-dependent enzyme [unclassified Bosea (in: a-proteobacteria)]CAD5250715.1 Cystathionine gamma-synthase [Bosea sp. 21B]CAD5263361.1 Cystathionine gamma-synthase [Bosea sp. 7B]CAD5271383.1 Cystathionine gamma-synthase [Bosea sp. 46]VVT43929.1 Cystathionine gamma-synthase [Bosea sp. EC-HK365B]VXB16517.1 Cystathionine gamma-synthase [Bosea sp. 29B]